MEGHLVPECPSIVGLDHIDFAVCRPVVCVRQPQCWPCTASVRGVQDVKDEEAIIVRFLRLDPDRVPTPDGIGICGVDLNDSGGVGRIGQVRPFGTCGIKIAVHCQKLSRNYSFNEAAGTY